VLGTQIGYREVKEPVELHNLPTDDVTIRLQQKYLIAGKVVVLNYRVFGGKTGPITMVWVIVE
jgi:hypothetical protein